MHRDPQHKMESWKRHAAEEEWQRLQDESENAKLKAENDWLRDQLAYTKIETGWTNAQVIIAAIAACASGAIATAFVYANLIR